MAIPSTLINSFRLTLQVLLQHVRAEINQMHVLAFTSANLIIVVLQIHSTPLEGESKNAESITTGNPTVLCCDGQHHPE